jgi:hypothetical protein
MSMTQPFTAKINGVETKIQTCADDEQNTFFSCERNGEQHKIFPYAYNENDFHLLKEILSNPDAIARLTGPENAGNLLSFLNDPTLPGSYAAMALQQDGALWRAVAFSGQARELLQDVMAKVTGLNPASLGKIMQAKGGQEALILAAYLGQSDFTPMRDVLEESMKHREETEQKAKAFDAKNTKENTVGPANASVRSGSKYDALMA